jgi:surface carbohydrate biosynthesis protein (TIGR04326 family)
VSSVSKSAALLIWDREERPPADSPQTFLWRSFQGPAGSGCISVPQWVEQNSDRMRGRYLGWLFELGEARVGDRRLIDHLRLRPGLSYWWMTPLAQRFNAAAGSPVHDAIKLLALEELIAERPPHRVVLHSSNAGLAKCLREYCGRSRIEFRWTDVGSGAASRGWRRWTPLVIQAMISAARHIARRRVTDPELAAATPDAQITFIDVLVHLDRPAFTTGRFVSNYWTRLVESLERAGVRTNWLHQFFQHEAVPSMARAEQLVRSFNEHARSRERHLLLDAGIDRTVVLRALRDWLRLSRASRRLAGVREFFQPAQSRVNLFPLFRDEWREGLQGPTAIINCLSLNMFELALARMPAQRLGIYIQENQPWEMALIHAWKAAGHERLIGVPHTTVRYWDLRYFYDARSYLRGGADPLPMPDRVAVNGPAARSTYLAAGYPEREIVDVEALRYMHLAARSEGVPRSQSLRILICGDFLPSTSHKMLSWMLQAAPALPKDVRFLFKPHPAYPISLQRYAALSLQPTAAPLGEALANCDVVFASNITSAAVDAFCRGIAVVQMLDGATFNMSPLRDMPGVRYVASADDLARALLDASGSCRVTAAPYFHLDTNLPRWSALLGISP